MRGNMEAALLCSVWLGWRPAATSQRKRCATCIIEALPLENSFSHGCGWGCEAKPFTLEACFWATGIASTVWKGCYRSSSFGLLGLLSVMRAKVCRSRLWPLPVQRTEP